MNPLSLLKIPGAGLLVRLLGGKAASIAVTLLKLVEAASKKKSTVDQEAYIYNELLPEKYKKNGTQSEWLKMIEKAKIAFVAIKELYDAIKAFLT